MLEFSEVILRYTRTRRCYCLYVPAISNIDLLSIKWLIVLTYFSLIVRIPSAFTPHYWVPENVRVCIYPCCHGGSLLRHGARIHRSSIRKGVGSYVRKWELSRRRDITNPPWKRGVCVAKRGTKKRGHIVVKDWWNHALHLLLRLSHVRRRNTPSPSSSHRSWP